MVKQPAAVFVRLYFKDQELSATVDRFTYQNLEQQSDVCNLTLTFQSLKDIPTKEIFQDKAELKVVFGFMAQEYKTKKIYVRQKNWTYGKQIVVNLLCTDKASNMISTNTRAVHNNTDMIGIAKTFGDKHNLKVSVELPQETSTEDFSKPDSSYPDYKPKIIPKPPGPVKLQVYGDYQRVVVDKSTYGSSIKDTNTIKHMDNQPDNYFLGVAFGWNHSYKTLVDVDKVINKNFSPYLSVAQGNDSDLSFLNRLGLNDPNGPTIPYTTDDELIIRKRNFKQTPYRSYEYKGDSGEVLSFSPQYKTYQKAGPANGVSYSGWDKSSKQFFNGSATAVNADVAAALNNYHREITFLKTLDPSADLGSFLIKDNKLLYKEGQQQIVRRVRPDDLRLSTQGSDNTNVILQSQIMNTVNVQEGIDILQRTVDDALLESKNLTDPTISNPVDAFNQASNNQINATLKMNAAILEVQFDAGLEVGKLITMLGVDEEHLGNYYIIGCEDNVNHGMGAITKLTLVRDGTAIKKPKAVNISKYLRTPNNQIGPLRGSNTKILK